MPLRNVTIFRDPTPDGFINQRYVITMVNIAKTNTDFSIEEFDRFVIELSRIAWKLAATWRHLDSYIRFENELIEAESAKVPIEKRENQEYEYSQDLYFELDGFLVQMKSTLDHLAKLPRFSIGRSWSPMNFSRKGQTVIKAIRSNVPDPWKERIPFLTRPIENSRPWLEMAIGARDLMNHYKDGGLDTESSVVVKTTLAGNEIILVPMWTEEMTLRKFMTDIWYALFELVEQFTINFLSLRFNDGIGFVYNLTRKDLIVSPIQVMPSDAAAVTLQVLEKLRAAKNETVIIS